MAAADRVTTDRERPRPGRRAVLKGAAATALLRLLTGGPARAGRTGAASTGATARLHVATFLAVDRAQIAYAIDVLRGLELWASTIPASREARLAVGSGPSDADTVAAWYDSVATGADVLVAPYGSPLTRVAFHVAEARRIPCIAPSAADPGLWDARRQWSVGVLEPTPTFFEGVLELMARRPSARRSDVALVYRNDPYSRSVMAGAARRAGALGFRRIVHHRFHDTHERAAAAGAASAATVLGTGYQPGSPGEGFLDDAVALARAVPRARTSLIALGVGAADPAFGPAAGAAAEGVVGVTGWRPYLPTPGNAAFVEAFRARWRHDPTAHVAQGFAAGQVLQGAERIAAARLRRSRATADGERPVPAREALRDALHALETETIFGRYRVDDGGRQVGHRPALVRWRDGRVAPLEGLPPDVPDGDEPTDAPTGKERA